MDDYNADHYCRQQSVMPFFHRLVVVEFIVAAVLGLLVFLMMTPPTKAMSEAELQHALQTWFLLSLGLGGSLAFVTYLLVWLFRGSLR